VSCHFGGQVTEIGLATWLLQGAPNSSKGNAARVSMGVPSTIDEIRVGIWITRQSQCGAF